MMTHAVPGLYSIGEAVDVTGWLAGYNFQRAWSFGWAAAQAIIVELPAVFRSKANICSAVLSILKPVAKLILRATPHESCQLKLTADG